MENLESVPVQESPAPQTVASVEVPAAPALGAELAMIKDLTGGNPVVTVLLAALVVVGGPAGWKFWTKRQESKKELEEKRLELETKVKLAKIKAESDDEECEKPKKKKSKE